MRVVDECVVYANPAPTYASEIYSGTSLAALSPVSGAAADAETLLCAFRVGSAKVSPDGRVALCESGDGGRTWRRLDSPMGSSSVGEVAPAGGPYQLAGPHLGSDGGVAVLAAARMRIAPPGTKDHHPDAAGIADAECVFATWTGTGWSDLAVVDARRTDDEWAIPCGVPVTLGEQQWFVPAERHGKPTRVDWLRDYHAFGLRSMDGGRTWTDAGPMLNDVERRVAHYDQHVAVVEGRLLSLAWAHDVVADRTLTARACWSVDGGATWSAAVDTGLVGGPIAPVVLPDGRVLVVYPRRTEPAGIRTCLSEDGGRTWLTADELVIWDDRRRAVVGSRVAAIGPGAAETPLWSSMWGWTFGLPIPALQRDGTVGVAFYAGDRDGRPAVRFVSLEV